MAISRSLPSAATTTLVRSYAWLDLPQLLERDQHLVLDLEEQALTLYRGRQILSQTALRLLALRVLLALLLMHQHGKTCRYTLLLAVQAATETQVASLLEDSPSSLVWLEKAAQTQDQQLRALEAEERERHLKPLRRAIHERGGLGPGLKAGRFPWEVVSRYGWGYGLRKRPVPGAGEWG